MASATGERIKRKIIDNWYRLRKFSTVFQPELRGQYSHERIENLLNYTLSTPTLWAIVVTVLSPFPCLVILILIDCAPLAPPKDGSASNYLFWMRDFLTIALMTRVILEQFRIAVPGLQMNSMHVTIMPIFSSAGAVIFMIGMASVIGFPLPFALVIGINVWFVVLVACFAWFFGRILREDVSLFKDLMRSIVVLICQVLLTFVYPAYLYGFINVEPAYEKFYVMLLPVIKIIARNCISYCLGDKYDLMPQLMIFNVDVFNALYVSSTMENSQSIVTILQVVALDVVLGVISISDIDHFMKTIRFLRHKIPVGHPLESASFLEIAQNIIEEDARARNRLVVRRLSDAMKQTEKISSAITVRPFKHAEAKSTSRRVLPVDALNSSIHTAPALQELSSLQLEPVQKNLKDIFSNKERQWFLERSAQVLFTAEFIILVEYTEVIIPFIYSMYTGAMFFLPNFAYYPQLQSIDQDSLASNLSEIVVYGIIEMVSLFVMGFIMQRVLGLSIVHLLSFVLDLSRRMVQSNLFLWICYTIQNSLEHNGADFSFAFSWLSVAPAE